MKIITIVNQCWHLFKRFGELCTEYFSTFHANSKFQFVRAAVNQIHSQTITTK